MSIVKLSSTELVANVKASTDLTQQEVISIMDVVEDKQKQNPLFKATIPEYLYKPPFGFPRNVNVPFLRNLAKNSYVNAVIKTLQDEAASTDWEIVTKEGVMLDESLEMDRLKIQEFFKNPNDDDESFSQILRKTINDFIVLDSPCWVKVYNPLGELIQFRSVDGGTIVKNPDIYGRIGGREDFIPFNGNFVTGTANINSDENPRLSDVQRSAISNFAGDSSAGAVHDAAVTQFRSMFADKAAYFQFSNTLMTSLPIPFGKKEIMFMIANPSPEDVYSFVSPLQASIDIVLSLVFGSKYNTDFYMNGNTPEGIIQMAGATPDQIKGLKERLSNSMYTGEKELGLSRRVGYRMPVTNSEDTKFIPLNFSSREMEIIAQQDWFIKVLWANMGVTPAEMGFGQSSNKATDENQSKVAARKGIKPLLSIIEFYINNQIMNELPNGKIFEFKFDEFDIAEEKKKRDLQQQEINMGIKTWQMIAIEEGIDLTKLESDKTANRDFENPMGSFEVENFKPNDKKQEPNKKEVEKKSSVDLDTIVNSIAAEIEAEGEKLVNEAEQP